MALRRPGHDVKLPRPGGPLSARHRSPLGVAGLILQKVCPGGSTFCLSLPLSFALPAPWAFPRPFVPAGPAWRIEAVDSPSEEDFAKETLALRYSWAVMGRLEDQQWLCVRTIGSSNMTG